MIKFDQNTCVIIRKLKEAQLDGYNSAVIFKDELYKNSDEDVFNLIEKLRKSYYIQRIDLSDNDFYIFVSKERSKFI